MLEGDRPSLGIELRRMAAAKDRQGSPGIEPPQGIEPPPGLQWQKGPLSFAAHLQVRLQPHPQFGYIAALLYPLSATEKNPKKGTLLDFWQGTLSDILLYHRRKMRTQKNLTEITVQNG